MPYRPKHPCGHPGCPALTHEQYCPEHAKLHAHLYEKYERDPDTWKHYGHRWRLIRKSFLSAHPLCEMCLVRGVMIPATDVHHIHPVKAGGTHEWSNLRSLCKSCHSSITIQSHS